MLKNILLVGLGGFVGSILRYAAYLLIDKRFDTSFPLSTFTVNIVGSFLLGIILAYSTRDALSEPMRLLLAVGLCGSFTTFSTFALENLNLLSQREIFTSFIYVALSTIIGIVAAWFGQWMVK